MAKKYVDNLELRRTSPLQFHIQRSLASEHAAGVEPNHLSRLKLSDFLLNEWLPSIEHKVEPNTYVGLLSHVRLHISPAIGNVEVARITPQLLEAFYISLLHKKATRRKGTLSKRSVSQVHATLHWALESLVRSGDLERNPARGLRPAWRKSGTFEIRIWTPAELRAFLKLTRGDPHSPIWHLLAMTGMRRGEVAGLKWGDMELGFRRVAIRRAIATAGSRTYVTTPKAATARVLELDSSTRRIVQRLASANGYPSQRGVSELFIFRNDENRFISPNLLSKRFRAIVERSDLPRIRLHDLRHTHASHLILAGANIKAVQERLGHADVIITLNLYSHLLPTTQREAISSLRNFYAQTM